MDFTIHTQDPQPLWSVVMFHRNGGLVGKKGELPGLLVL